MKQTNQLDMTPRLTDDSENTPEANARMKIANKHVKNSLARIALGIGDHVEYTETKTERDGVITKVVTKTTTTPRKPIIEACKFLLDRYESKNKKAKPAPIESLLPKPKKRSKRAKR